MKKKIITIAAFIMLAIGTTFANDNGISKNALLTFSEAFTNATDVKWEKEDHYYKVAFQENNLLLKALISEEGKLIAVSRNILSTDLPISLQASYRKNYTGYWISELTEYAIGNETRYFLTLENADQKILMENVGTHNWSPVKTIVK
ncbi:MAG: hypothetical protein QM726_13420 [Chitinophagaceae bacterium]